MSMHGCWGKGDIGRGPSIETESLGLAVSSIARSGIWRLPDASSGGGSTESQ